MQSFNTLFSEDELVISPEDLSLITDTLDLQMNGGKTIKDSLNEVVEQVNYQKEEEMMRETFNPKLVPESFGLDQPFSFGSSQLLYVA